MGEAKKLPSTSHCPGAKLVLTLTVYASLWYLYGYDFEDLPYTIVCYFLTSREGEHG